MSWRVEALWRAPVGPGVYSRDGGDTVEYGEVQEFAELDDAKRRRAEILQRHPGAVVSLEDSRVGANRRAGRVADAETTAVGLKRARQVLDRGGR